MRCIAHIDMDCFYAQVEAVRLGIDCRVTPLVLAQWGSLIAVNYPARARGVKRFNNVSEALALCPELVVALSPSYRMGESVSQYHPNPVQDSYKISLEPYRRASRQIFAILASTPGVQVEKGSVDEAYVDVTEAAGLELAGLRAAAAAAGAAAPLDALTDVMEPSTRLIADRRAEMEVWLAARGTSLAAAFDEPMRALLRGECGAALVGSRGFCVDAGDAAYAERCLLLCAASRVVWRLRQRIYAELRYDCSAGIAHNRVLAKCISATHKPNQQTLLLPDRSASALFGLPLSGLRGFGGKFGAAVSAVCGGATECREAWLVPLAQLRRLDGTCEVGGDDADGGEEGADAEAGRRQGRPRAVKRKRAASESPERGRSPAGSSGSASYYAYYRMRGLAEDTISNRPVSKTLIASKNFGRHASSIEVVHRWVVVLCGELCSRYEEFTTLFHLRGRNFNVKLGNEGFWRMAGLANRTVVLPVVMQPDILAAAAMREVQLVFRDNPNAAPDSVTLTIGGFVSDGSGSAGAVPSLAAIAGDARDATHAAPRQQTLLSSFRSAAAAAAVASITPSGGVGAGVGSAGKEAAEVLSSSDDDSDACVAVDEDGEGRHCSVSSRRGSSLGDRGDGLESGSVVLLDPTPLSPNSSVHHATPPPLLCAENTTSTSGNEGVGGVAAQPLHAARHRLDDFFRAAAVQGPPRSAVMPHGAARTSVAEVAVETASSDAEAPLTVEEGEDEEVRGVVVDVTVID